MGKALTEHGVIMVLIGFPYEHCKPVMDVIKDALGKEGSLDPDDVGFVCVPEEGKSQMVLVHVNEDIYDQIEGTLRKVLNSYLDGRSWPVHLAVRRVTELNIHPE
jgi:hypothetical protein